ncbi:two-component system sporulation sensor kinase A [Ureibacillus xyleni]|uniref:histidine kinase n=2 Tax=Ureibacillus xyleni TaxID=614648 RepID=A0A285TUV1_9BACL|nr:two-component system sporulation sensor kinase A [Ureibacillus xyleni]
MIETIDSIDIDFHKLIENSLNAIFILGEEGKIHYCNKAVLRLLKLTSIEEILHNSLYNFIPTYIHGVCKERLNNVLLNQQAIDCIEAQMIRKDGEIIDVEVKTAPLKLGNEVFAQVVIQDITDRKLAVKLFSEREKLASLGQIAASIVHEVKNPLTRVKGFLQLLKQDQPHNFLDTMDSELEKALTILHSLLFVSKPDLTDEPFVSIELSKEIESTLSLFQEKLENVKLVIQIRDSNKKVVGKRNSLLKAIFNLIKNAIEAISEEGTIKVEHYYQNGWVHVKVSDSGVGVSQEQLKMLGTPFFTTKDHGTGLGLTQVYTTIYDQGGDISVQSEVGKGTTFHVKLPALKE